ncbi:MAG: CBS domain-containing protein [Symploca sp. SIO1A3]|nr:CBS domain-containing protein [Symploca sp. SIO1A3]
MYVVDEYGKPVGVVNKLTMEAAVQQECDDFTSLMQTDFPTVEAPTYLENIFHLYQQGIPVAVVDEEGKFTGVVEYSDVLASIGKD